ncbi:hypothetical protein V2J09_015961 [Rumex salicifolius]
MELHFWIFIKNWRNVFDKDELGVEIAQIAIPAALALTADPIASLIDTAFIGHLGPVELAAVGVAIAVFNQASRIAIFPLVSITTSFVAEEDAKESELKELMGRRDEFKHDGDPIRLELEAINVQESESEDLLPKEEDSDMRCKASNLGCSLKNRRRHIPSASTAMVIGAMLGLIQALFLICAAQPILNYMGVVSDSAMFNPAMQYLTLRSLGAPAVLLSLAMQGVFRGFKDTKTPLYAVVAGDAVNIVLDPILIFSFHMGVTGAAIAHVYYLPDTNVEIAAKSLSFTTTSPRSEFRKVPKKWILIAVKSHSSYILCDTCSFIVCKAWAMLASSFAKNDFDRVTSAAARVLQLGLVLGIVLSIVLAVILQVAPRLFTDDANVLALISLGIPFVAATQPINALAFIFDGINYGASDFAYSASSMICVAIVSILCLLSLSSSNGFVGIWISLSIYMSFRALAGFWRIGTGTGPWKSLKV